jgi:hypothetical protein
MIPLDMKPEQMVSHFQNLVARTDFSVKSSESDATKHIRVSQKYRLPGDLIITATHDTSVQCTKIVLKQKQLNTMVMAGSLDNLSKMVDVSRQWFIHYPDAGSIVPVANEEALLIHHQTTLADLRHFLTWLTIEYQLLNFAFQPKITVDYGQMYGGWGNCGHGNTTQYYQAASGKVLLQQVIPALERLMIAK